MMDEKYFSGPFQQTGLCAETFIVLEVDEMNNQFKKIKQ